MAGPALDFLGVVARAQRQQAQAGAAAFHALRIEQFVPEHLQAAADRQQRLVGLRMTPDRIGHTGRLEPLQVFGNVLGAGQDQQVGSKHRFRVAGPAQVHAWQRVERLKLVQIADARIRHHDDRQRAGSGGTCGRGVEDTVFLGQAVVALQRQHAHGGHAGQRLQHLRAGREQAGVAPELVQHEAADQRALGGRQQLVRAVEVREGATAVDVAHQQHRRAGLARHPHVGDVAAVQVDLGGRAGAFDHQHIVLGHQRVQGVARRGPHQFAAAAPRHAREFGVPLAEQDHLAAVVALGLEQDRVHPHLGHPACRHGLEILGAAHFTPGHDTRVVAHVLRLVGRDFQATPRVPAAQRGREKTFASAAGGAANHHGFGHFRGHVDSWAAWCHASTNACCASGGCALTRTQPGRPNEVASRSLTPCARRRIS